MSSSNLQKESNTQLLFAPLQGYTDFRFRGIYNQFFTGIDVFYSPWIILAKNKELKKSHIRDVLPENNTGYKLIPQIMTNDTESFLYLSNYLYDLGYEEINWNLGCPYPMIAKRGMGSGLLKDPESIVGILKKVIPLMPNKLSLKMRLGYDDFGDTYKILPLLNEFPLSEIIIHARTAKQMYKGEVNLDMFEKCLDQTTHCIGFNGDIDNYASFNELKNRFQSIKKWMIGRWAIANPFLPEMIKNESDQFPKNSKELFLRFHNTLMDIYANQLSGEKHLLMKMIAFWEYFSWIFTNSHKVFKRIKKSKSIKAYKTAVLINIEDGFR